jgi:hypothetical protein
MQTLTLPRTKIPPAVLMLLIFLGILFINAVFYWGFQNNYFFSDDFEWLSRAVSMQNSFSEILSIKGRDFNPVFLFLLWALVKFAGLSPVIFRTISLFTFSATAWFFFYILKRYFKIDPFIAFTCALFASLNVFVSEVTLNLSALVYSLSLLFFFIALHFYLSKKRLLFILFLALGVMAKEAIIPGILPIILYEKETRERLYTIASTVGIILVRALLQLGATGSYTEFLSFKDVFIKLYFILLRSMNISPYSIPAPAGIGVIVLLLLVSIYFFIRFGRSFLFFFSFLCAFTLFFALLPKLSSRYFFFPSFGAWGIAAFLFQYFYYKNKILKFMPLVFLLFSIMFNYSLIQNEIGDYKILGDFSKHFISNQADFIKKNTGFKTGETIIYKKNSNELTSTYRQIIDRDNLPKLLPIRPHGVGGVINPEDLIPIIFFPEKIVRWRPVNETDILFKGVIIDAFVSK